MDVLIIGGTRRCGPYLVEELLNRGHSVTCYHRGEHNVFFSDRAKEIHGDRRDYPKFASQMSAVGADVVIDMMARDNADVRSVTEVFRGRIDRYVCISSFEVYAAFEAAWDHTPSFQPVPIPEDAPKRKEFRLYADDPQYDKLLVEQEAMEAHARGDFSVTVLRWPALYGPRDTTPREWYYVKQVLDGRKKIEVPESGQALFSRGYFENMAHSVVLAVENERAGGEIYNAADTQALSVRQIAGMVADVLGHTWEIVSLPRQAMPPSPQTSAFPSSRVPYDVEPHLLLDLTKIRRDVGYTDLVPIRKAMENTVGWLCEHPLKDGAPIVHRRGMSHEDRQGL